MRYAHSAKLPMSASLNPMNCETHPSSRINDAPVHFAPWQKRRPGINSSGERPGRPQFGVRPSSQNTGALEPEAAFITSVSITRNWEQYWEGHLWLRRGFCALETGMEEEKPISRSCTWHCWWSFAVTVVFISKSPKRHKSFIHMKSKTTLSKMHKWCAFHHLGALTKPTDEGTSVDGNRVLFANNSSATYRWRHEGLSNVTSRLDTHVEPSCFFPSS
ncbi:hypothetical protein CDAR_31101 [Caerostris darwini]|uniref:Uncharacterized protein n=1 Tax=Caerostris darwini TaxID=1538125 RepID=A0AAV4RWQ4_9ARAC|nr:hypothetical protein CDAR_31101 [Caerostris darwini]